MKIVRCMIRGNAEYGVVEGDKIVLCDGDPFTNLKRRTDMADLKSARLLVLDKEASAVLEVAQGKADAFIYDQMSTYQNWKKNQETTRAILNPFQQEKWGIALRQGDEQLKGQVNQFLKAFREQGGFERLGDTYLKEQKQTFKELNYPFFF